LIVRLIRAALLGVFAAPLCAQVPRILYVGDSWTYYPWAEQDPPALRSVLARPEVGLGNYVEDGTIALLQPTAAGWDADGPKDAIRQKLEENPTIDIVHISLGGNDVNYGLQGNFSPEHIASMNGAAVDHIENIVDFIHSLRPDIRVAICGYDYLNITEGFTFNNFTVVQSIEDPTALAYLLYGLNAVTAADVLANQRKLNDVFVDLEQRKLDLSLARTRTRYIHNFGLMQAVFGIPSLSVPPNVAATPVGWSGNYSNFPGGNRDLFSPRVAMDGSSGLDPIHLSPGGYIRLMENAVAQVYYQWLKDSVAPVVEDIEVAATTEAGGGVVDFVVTFSEPVTGVDLSDFEIIANGVEDTELIGVSGGEGVYYVSVAYGEGLGTIRLDVVDDDTIYDAVFNPLGKKNLVHAPGDGDYRSGPSVLVGGVPEGENPEGEQDCIAPPTTPRVLIVGDSWAAGVFLTAALDEVLDEFGLTHAGVVGDTTAIGGSKAEQWATSEWRAKITAKLVENPTIDSVHLIMGGNDVLARIKNTDVFEGVGALLRETWWAQIETAITTVVQHCLSFPQVKKVVIADYDYLNSFTAHFLDALSGGSNDFGGMSQYEVNQAFIEVGQLKKGLAQRTENCEYVHNFGLLQYHFRTPSWAARPGGPPLYLPYPGGDSALPMPDAAFDTFVLLDITLPGDGIHPSEEAHKVMLRNAVEQVYYALYAPELICPEGEGEGAVEGGEEGDTEGPEEGEGAREGEGISDGEVTSEGEAAPEGEGAADGETSPDGEGFDEGEGAIEGEGSAEGEGPEGEGTSEGANDGEDDLPARHTADINGNGKLDLSELLRLIQLFNGKGFGCGDEPDGYTLESESRDCPFHSSDYAEPRWILTLSELLRSVQLFNVGGYTICETGEEDGFCPAG
jgi:lysophospholipase L1-like esterase